MSERVVCDYCLTAISFEAPHNEPCAVQDAVAQSKKKVVLNTTDLTDEDFAAMSDVDLLDAFVQYSNHSSHLRFAARRWSHDSKRVYDYLREHRNINADERFFI